MNAEQLLFAIGDLSDKTVTSATLPPKRRVVPLWATAAAVAAAVAVGILGYIGFLKTQRQKPPVATPTPAATTPAPTTTTTVWGTGGDTDACTVHSFEYHNIDGYLLDLVPQEAFNVFIEKYKGEDMTILAFVDYFGITREQFVSAMRWEDKLDMTALQHHPNAPYTYGQFVDAVYGDDAELTAWVFDADTLQYPETKDVYLFDGLCETHQMEYHRINGELIKYVDEDVWNAYLAAHEGEEANILTFVKFCGITREEYIQALGWEKALDHVATWHGMGYEYTCGDFVEALYGDDEAFREYMFSWDVFPMLNPTGAR